MKLYGYWKSSATWRVRIALAYKEIEHSYTPVELRIGPGEQNAPEFLNVNPMRQVPVLQLDDGTRLGQSIAILEYLEERYPKPALLPEALEKRALVRQIAEMINAGIQPLQNHSVGLYIKSELGHDPVAFAQHWVARGLRAVETVVAGSAGRFAVADALSFADLLIVPELGFARAIGLDVAGYPALLKVEAECAGLDCFHRALPSAQPDAPLDAPEAR